MDENILNELEEVIIELKEKEEDKKILQEQLKAIQESIDVAKAFIAATLDKNGIEETETSNYKVKYNIIKYKGHIDAEKLASEGVNVDNYRKEGYSVLRVTYKQKVDCSSLLNASGES